MHKTSKQLSAFAWF